MLDTLARPFYGRRVLRGLLFASPIFLLGGAYLLVTQVLLVPRVPDASASGDVLARFIMHPKGLVQLSPEPREALLRVQTRRLFRDEVLRERFLAEIRTASADDQRAFREHMFDTLKPLFLRDAQAWAALGESRRAAFLDERIVDYNRLGAPNVSISRHDLGGAAPGGEELLQWVLGKTTDAERRSFLAYAAALAGRVKEILADPQLKADLEARIAAE